MDPEDLTPQERAWVERDVAVWRRARAIAARHPGMDAGDVRHVLYNLERTPEERLWASLNHAGLRLLAR
jgi:hypothetical protein